MTFKEQLEKDVRTTFLNPEEFGEEHVIDGKKMLVVIDNNELADWEKRLDGSRDGVYAAQMLLYVSSDDFGPRPSIGRIIKVDEKEYVVTDVFLDEGGMYSLHLEDAQSW